MKLFNLEIITPERTVFRDKVSSLIVPAYEGYLGVLAGHAPFICNLSTGEIVIQQESGPTYLVTSGGLMEVTPEKTTILPDNAEAIDNIDLARAEAARKRALERLKSTSPEVDLNRVADALKRAENRIKIVKRRA